MGDGEGAGEGRDKFDGDEDGDGNGWVVREGVNEKEDVEGATERARVTDRVRLRIYHTYSVTFGDQWWKVTVGDQWWHCKSHNKKVGESPSSDLVHTCT